MSSENEYTELIPLYDLIPNEYLEDTNLGLKQMLPLMNDAEIMLLEPEKYTEEEIRNAKAFLLEENEKLKQAFEKGGRQLQEEYPDTLSLECNELDFTFSKFVLSELELEANSDF